LYSLAKQAARQASPLDELATPAAVGKLLTLSIFTDFSKILSLEKKTSF